jgi:hypothetical protein
MCREICRVPLPSLAHTDAEVLATLLHRENQECHLAKHQDQRLSPDALLEFAARLQPRKSVLTDAGAQVVTNSNLQTARRLLQLSAGKAAAVFFSEMNEKRVVSDDGHDEPLASSRFRQNLEDCVFFINDAQSRGSDFIFPADFRAAVTLGPHMTRDQLAQGAMRMRMLGKSHAVCYLVPPDVERNLRLVINSHDRQLMARDVLRWTIENTCSELESAKASCAWRSLSYNHRSDVIDRHRQIPKHDDPREIGNLLPEKDRFSMEDLYEPDKTTGSFYPPSLHQDFGNAPK